MSLIDNFEQIKKLLTFSKDKEYFYFCQIIVRRKDLDDQSTMSSNNIVIRTIYIDSLEKFNREEKIIKNICKETQGRAYINIAPKSYKLLTKQMLKLLTDRICNEDYISPQKISDSAAGMIKSFQPVWLVDIDDKDYKILNLCTDIIDNKCEPFDNIQNSKIIDVIETKNGCHLLTKPFNLNKFQEECKKAGLLMPDVHKNNPTILYIN